LAAFFSDPDIFIQSTVLENRAFTLIFIYIGGFYLTEKQTGIGDR
jgi:hypothetical protein